MPSMIGMRCLVSRLRSSFAFGRRGIPPPPQRGCRVGDPGSGGVAPPSNTPGILGRRALPVGHIAALGATMDLHHGLLAAQARTTAPAKAQPAKAPVKAPSAKEPARFGIGRPAT